MLLEDQEAECGCRRVSFGLEGINLDFLSVESSAFDALLNSAHDLSLMSLLLLFVYLQVHQRTNKSNKDQSTPTFVHPPSLIMIFDFKLRLLLFF